MKYAIVALILLVLVVISFGEQEGPASVSTQEVTNDSLIMQILLPMIPLDSLISTVCVGNYKTKGGTTVKQSTRTYFWENAPVLIKLDLIVSDTVRVSRFFVPFELK